MASKIKSVTVVNGKWSNWYCVGGEFNGLILDHIKDKSVEYSDALIVIYMGFTKDNDIVFEVINAPVDIAYEIV